MANVSHSTLTGAQLHEPKGVAAATAGTVYIADGAGSGSWTGLVPVGAVIPYAGTSAPSRFLLCYGQAISRTTYSVLFSAIGTTYGSGDGSTTFNLPDLRGRVVAGQDDMGGTSANRMTGTYGPDGDTLGATGGAESHTLEIAQIPSHTHTYGRRNGAGATATGGDNRPYANETTAGSGATGGGEAHNNVQPTIILNYIIYTAV